MRITTYLRNEWQHLARINRSERPWEMPAAAALASGLPVMVGIGEDALRQGLAASLGGLIFLYTPTATSLIRRMQWLVACLCGMTACYAMGLAAHLWPAFALPILVGTTFGVMVVCRSFSVAPPGGMFFVMAAAIAAFSPIAPEDAPRQVLCVALGGAWAMAVAWIYYHYMVKRSPAFDSTPPARRMALHTVLDAGVIAAFVWLSLGAAQALELPRPYWVPVSCLAIIQGASLRVAWTRQLQRTLGTIAGLVVFAGIAHLGLGPWGMACTLTALIFVVETLVVRHYGLAAVFITPMAILMAEVAQGPMSDPYGLMSMRLADTVLGACIGLAGAAFLHSARYRQFAGRVS